MRGLRVSGALVGVLLVAVGCSSGGAGAGGTLAKLDGWREGGTPGEPYAMLELAYDEQSARAMWDENVGDDLPTRSGLPVEPGRYGDLGDVDLATQVLAVYSSGQGGGCPRWLGDVRTDDERTVAITTVTDMQGGNGCNDDYNAYRVLVAIDRNDLPPRDAIGGARLVVDGDERLGAVIGTYPVAP